MSKTVKIDNNKLYDELKKWKDTFPENCTPENRPRIPEFIGYAIMHIAEGLSNRWNYASYTEAWKEAMVGDGIELSIKYIHNFDADKYKNPHAYITMICNNAFIQRIRKEKRETATRYNFFAVNVFDPENEEHGQMIDEGFYQDILDKINDYENSIVKKEKVKEEEQPQGLDLIL